MRSARILSHWEFSQITPLQANVYHQCVVCQFLTHHRVDSLESSPRNPSTASIMGRSTDYYANMSLMEMKRDGDDLQALFDPEDDFMSYLGLSGNPGVEFGRTPRTKSGKRPRQPALVSSSGGSSSGSFLATPPSAQPPQKVNKRKFQEENSDFFNDYDLEGFTTEEINAYNLMAEPGQRLQNTRTPRKTALGWLSHRWLASDHPLIQI